MSLRGLNYPYCMLLVFLASCGNFQGKDKKEKIDHVMEKAYTAQKYIGNVLVADSGRVIYKKSFGKSDAQSNSPNSDSTKFLIASLSKPVTAIIILRLVDKSLLKLDAPINSFFKTNNSLVGKVTIHQLLTHSSGIKEFIGKEANNDILTLLNMASLEFAPGSDFKYSNSGYVLLIKIAEQITGKTYEEIVKSEVFEPAKMTSSGVARNNKMEILAKGYKDATQKNSTKIDYPLENVDGAGSLYSTTGDLFKLDSVLRTNSLLTENTKALMLKQQIPKTYGYGWFIRERGGTWDVYWHKGDIAGFTSFISRRTQKNQLIILLANAENLDLADIEGDIARILKSANQ